MTQEEVIRMAMQVGCTIHEARAWQLTLNAFAQLVEERAIASERESCAKLAESCDKRATPKGIAAAIRVRGAE